MQENAFQVTLKTLKLDLKYIFHAQKSVVMIFVKHVLETIKNQARSIQSNYFKQAFTLTNYSIMELLKLYHDTAMQLKTMNVYPVTDVSLKLEIRKDISVLKGVIVRYVKNVLININQNTELKIISKSVLIIFIPVSCSLHAFRWGSDVGEFSQSVRGSF